MSPSLAAFYLIGTIAVGFAVVAVTSVNLVRAALALVFSFFTLAGIFWLLGSPFVAVQQLVVNAGAIPIVTIFIVMMTRSRSETGGNVIVPLSAALLAVPAGLALLWLLSGPVGQADSITPISTERIGAELLSQRGAELELSTGPLSVETGSLIAFEATAVVLLVAFVGAIILARRESSLLKAPPEAQEQHADA